LPPTKLTVIVQPNASKEAFGFYNGHLKVFLTAPAKDNKANEALVVFLAKTLGIRKSQVTVIKGHTSRHKQVLVRGINPPLPLLGGVGVGGDKIPKRPRDKPSAF